MPKLPSALRKPSKPGEGGDGARREGTEAPARPQRGKVTEGAIDVVGWVDQRTGASP